MATRRRARTQRRKGFLITHFQLLVIVVLVIVGALIFVTKFSYGRPNVLGVATSSYRSSIVYWNGVPGAAGYNIYYKESSDKGWTNAVRDLPRTSTSYTIEYLSEKKGYQYIVKAYDNLKKEFWVSEEKSIVASN